MPAGPKAPAAVTEHQPDPAPAQPAVAPKGANEAPLEKKPAASEPAAHELAHEVKIEVQPPTLAATPVQESRTDVRTPEPETPAPTPVHTVSEPRAQPQSQPQPIRDLTLRLTANQQDHVDIKVVERSGEVHVAVRSVDPELSNSLQQGIGDLVTTLENKGIHTEAWRPTHDAPHPAAVSAAPADRNTQTSQDPQQRRQPQPEFVPQRSRKSDQPAWVNEIDGALSPLLSEYTRRTT